ncbi:MAG: hypothetical protein R2810_06520 [Flavobacteriales bacterium]
MPAAGPRQGLRVGLWNKGYTKPAATRNIQVLGRKALGIVYVGANSMLSGHYISEHDALISEKLGTCSAAATSSRRR